MKLFGSMHEENNELYIGGISSKELAKKYGTPLYVIDEKLVRQNCKEYYENFKVKEKKIELRMRERHFYQLQCVKS